MSADAEWPGCSPRCAAHQDFGHDPARRELFPDPAPDRLGSERPFPEGISEQATKGRLTRRGARDAAAEEGAHARRWLGRRPDDVKPPSQFDVANDVLVSKLQLPQHRDPPDPDRRLVPGGRRLNLVRRIKPREKALVAHVFYAERSERSPLEIP